MNLFSEILNGWTPISEHYLLRGISRVFNPNLSVLQMKQFVNESIIVPIENDWENMGSLSFSSTFTPIQPQLLTAKGRLYLCDSNPQQRIKKTTCRCVRVHLLRPSMKLGSIGASLKQLEGPHSEELYVNTGNARGSRSVGRSSASHAASTMQRALSRLFLSHTVEALCFLWPSLVKVPHCAGVIG